MTSKNVRESLFCLVALLAFNSLSQAAPISTNLQLWLDGADTSTLRDAANLTPTDGGFAGTIQTWQDKSGFSRHATAPGATNRPTYTGAGANGNGALSFGRSADSLASGADVMRGALSAGMSAGDITFFVVSNAATIGARRTIFDTAPTGGGPATFGVPQMQDLDGTNVGFHNGGVADPPRIFTGSVAAMQNNWFSSSLTRSGGAAAGNGSQVTIKQDGSTSAAMTAAQTWNSGTSSAYGIGEQVSYGNYYDGRVTEVLAYNRALNTAERRIVENYLSSKYNMGLAGADDKYQGDTVGNGNYDRNVFGIGRDVAQGASPAGANLTGSSDGLTLSELNSSLANGDYALAGNRVATNGVTDGRWDRAYYVDVTGNVDARLTFDFSDAGLTGMDPAAFGLLYSSTNEAGLQPLGLGGTVLGDQISFDLFGLQDGIYALSIIPLAPEPSTFAMFGIVVAAGMGVRYFGRRSR